MRLIWDNPTKTTQKDQNWFLLWYSDRKKFGHHAGRRTVFNETWFWKDFQNAMDFQNQGTFSSNVGVIQVFSQAGFNSVGLENPKEFSKIPRFLEGFKRGLYFLWFFFEKSSSNLVNQYFSLWEKYWLTKDWNGGFWLLSTMKADFCVSKIPCVLKTFSKPRRIRPVLTERYWNWFSKAGTLCQKVTFRGYGVRSR